MDPSRMLKRTAPFLALGLLACAGSSVTRRTEIGENGRAEGTTSTQTRIFTNPDEATLDKARSAHRDGQYDEAAAGFQSVYDNTAARQDLREQALYELARVRADLLNPKKDPDEAARLFEKFIAEFPKSKLVDKAKEQIETLRKAGAAGS